MDAKKFEMKARTKIAREDISGCERMDVRVEFT